jgi:Spy/CpxP family protein refolding chaperone
MGRMALGLLLLATSVAAGCAGGPGQIATPDESPQATSQALPADDGEELPEALQDLELSPSQRERVVALSIKLQTRLTPLMEAGRELMLVTAKAVSRCDADSLGLDAASSWTVTSGEQVRGAVLDAIDELHAILTPAQRKILSERLLDRSENARTQRNQQRGARGGASKLSAAVDLSVGQILVVLTRALALRSSFEERMDPWRREVDRALRAFPEDDFSIRDHEFAQVPAVALLTTFVREALRTLLPVLEPEQCKALGAAIVEAAREKPAVVREK